MTTSIVAFVAPLGFCLTDGLLVTLAGTAAVLLGKVLVLRRGACQALPEAMHVMVALLVADLLMSLTGLPSHEPTSAQIGVLALAAMAIDAITSQAARIGEGLARAVCSVSFAVLVLQGLNTERPVWWLLAVIPAGAHYLETNILLTRESALNAAQRLLHLPTLIAVRRTTVDDLVPLLDDLRRIMGSELLWMHTTLPSGAVSIESSADGSRWLEGRPEGHLDIGCRERRTSPELIGRKTLPASWTAGVYVPLVAPDGRDAGYLMLGWTGLSGPYLARWMISGVLGGAMVSTGHALGAFWANLWTAHHLERERSRLAAAIDHSDVAILVLEAVGRVVVWNAAMANLTGTAGPEARGRLPGELFALTDENGSAVELTDGLHGSFRLTTPAGRHLRVEVSTSAPPEANAPGLLTAVFVDKSASHQLEHMRHLLLMSIQHELHGPLTSISGHAQLLDGSSVDEEETASLRAITDSVEMMHHVIADLVLVLGEDPTAQPAPAREPIDVHRLLRRTLQNIPSVAARTVTEVPAELTVLADSVRLRQCLLLVLGNAEKYAPEGKITIALRRDGDWGVISICDDGPGIPDAERDLVLKPFYRSAATQSLPGSGMGLYIAEMTMRSMDGLLELGSAPSGGLRVDLRFPLPPRVTEIRSMRVEGVRLQKEYRRSR